jgi:hypothetical protein
MPDRGPDSSNDAFNCDSELHVDVVAEARHMLTSLRAFSYRTLGPAGGGSIGSHACGFRITLRAFLVALVILPPAIPAKAHEHVDADGTRVNWYPKECCHDHDCRPVATVKKAPHGLWLTTTDGQTVLIGPRDQRRPSGDSRWHICIGPDDVDSSTPKIFCIFEPGSS